MRERIEALFRDVLSPLFEADGGSIEFVDLREHVVKLRVGGAYRGCPSTTYTVEGVVLPALRKTVGDDVRVELV